MTVNYIGKKTVIRDSFKEYAEKRLKKLGKFFDDDPVVNIIVTNHNEDETVEVTIQSHGMFFRAERTSDDRQTSLFCRNRLSATKSAWKSVSNPQWILQRSVQLMFWRKKLFLLPSW